MKLWVFDQDFEMKGEISFISLIWEEAYQARGAFTLVVNDTKENISLLQEEYFLYMTDKKTAMVIKRREFDSQSQTIIVNGYTTIELIDQRTLIRTKIFSNAEQGMKDALSENLRDYPRITQTENKGYPETFGIQRSNSLLLDVFSEICAETGLGIILLFDYENQQHIFDVYKGVNRTFEQEENIPVLFSDEWMSLSNMVVIDDKSLFKNVAYVWGAGEGEERIMVEVGTAQGRDRFELPVDARDLQPEENQTESEYKAILQARGIAKLNEHIRGISFQAEINSDDFGVKYNLGDEVTCKSQKYGIQINTRIMYFKQVIENNVSKVYLTLGESKITAIGELRIWLS